MKIPPPGSDPTGLAEAIDRLVRESLQDGRRQAWLSEAERALNLYLGNHYETNAPADVVRLVLNRIQNCIVSLVAVQAGDPPKVEFHPRETGEPPLVYLNTQIPEGRQLAMQLITTGVVTDLMQPLPDDVAVQLKQQVDTAQMLNAQAAQLGLPTSNQMPADVLVEVTDQTTAEALQTVFDAMWEECDAHQIFAENVLYKNVLGWQPTLYEFDDDSRNHVLTNVHPKHVFPDPIHTDVSRWQYVVFDQPISADEAVAKWPYLEKELRAAADRGNIQWAGSAAGYDKASMFDQQFERDMVMVRTAWIRNQPFPMSRDEALAGGHIETRDVPTGDMNVVPDPVTGEPTSFEPVTRQADYVTGTDVELPGDDHPSWPTKLGIRMITVVRTAVVDDREAETCDIPLPANRNVPIPFSPYGQGEPKRLEGVQMAINKILSGFVTHHAYNAFPPEVLPISVAQRLDKTLDTARTKPGQRLMVEDHLLVQLGGIKNVIGNVEAAQLPADFWRLLDLLLELIDKEGNQSDVTQGNASDTWSGETVKALQNAASQIIRGKSMFTEFYLKRLARLMVYSITDRLDADDWRKYLSRYPIQAIAALHTRAKSLDIDISVQIESGSGSSKAAETQNIVAARQMGVAISDPTIMEQLGVDPEIEQQKAFDWARKQAMLAGQQPQAAVAPNNPPQDQGGGPTRGSVGAAQPGMTAA